MVVTQVDDIVEREEGIGDVVVVDVSLGGDDEVGRRSRRRWSWQERGRVVNKRE